jgi:hypothetical protein
VSKKPRKAAPGRVGAMVALADAQKDAALPLIEVPAGGTLRVIVDVGPMTIPYTVAYNGRAVINKSLVDRSELVLPLEPGDRTLAWAFSHGVKEWSHTVGVSVDEGAPRVLEQRSEKNKDPDQSVGVAVVRVGGTA